ncbi:MAG TPA: aldo/keto reductase [Chloroflexota bacterium]|nr:aldo/keto reductase [Chloroflexota bacterium]
MDYRNLGRTGLKVSELCMGTMQFGWTSTEEEAFAVLDAFVESGGNFLDTADVYTRWVEGNPGGVAEQIIGRWMQSRGNRQQIVLATKVRGQMGPGPNDVGLSRKHILEAVEASLRRLQTDYIDLYQSHSDDQDVPLDETMEAFDNLVQRGLVRYVGASNYAAWRLMKALCVSEVNGYARYDSLQPVYSLARRSVFEQDLGPLCLEEGLGVIPYSPLANGFLTGKYRRGQPLPESGRAENVKNRYMHENGFRLLDCVDEVAARHNAMPAQIALAWLLARPGITAPITSANTPEQWQELATSTEVDLTPQDIEQLDEASAWS